MFILTFLMRNQITMVMFFFYLFIGLFIYLIHPEKTKDEQILKMAEQINSNIFVKISL